MLQPEWEPLKRRIFVFSVPERARFTGSKLYQPQHNRGSMSRVEDVWILTAAKDCRFPWKRGEHCYITDGFELEPVRLEQLWDQYGGLPEFAELREFVASVEGKVECQIVHEESVLAKAEI